MLQGIQLTLMMGKGIAKAVPKAVIDALTSVQVSSGKAQSGFQLAFTLGKNSPLMHTLLPNGFFDPIVTRVIIVVTLNGTPHVLMDGLITNQELAPSSQAGASTLTVTGDDLSVAMDLIQNIIPYPATNDYLKILMRLAPYAALGIVPVVIPPIFSFVFSPTEKHETQKSTDKAYIQELAKANGYVFYIQPGPTPGMSVAYFGPEINIQNVQSALSINMDSWSNVDGLSFSLNGLAKSVQIYYVLDPVTQKIPIPIPIPDINPLKPPITAGFTPPFKVEIGENLSGKKTGEIIRDIATKLLNSDNKSVTASGSIDVFRYGKIVKARTLIGVRGAGIAYDGLYYVDSVTHEIKAGSYKQNVSLSRDGLRPLSNKVKI